MHEENEDLASVARIHIRVLVLLIVVLVFLIVMFRMIFPGNQSDEIDLTGFSSVSVVLTNDGFEPRSVRIRNGTAVTFSTSRGSPFWPASSLHPNHKIYPEFDPRRPVSSDETWKFVFDQPGVWRYHDHIHSYFTGTIYVVD